MKHLFLIVFKPFFSLLILFPSQSTHWLSSPLGPTPAPPQSLRPPVSWGFGAFFLTEPRPATPLLSMCWGPHISWYMLPGWWSNVWQILGVLISSNCFRDLCLLFMALFALDSRSGGTLWFNWTNIRRRNQKLNQEWWKFRYFKYLTTKLIASPNCYWSGKDYGRKSWNFKSWTH